MIKSVLINNILSISEVRVDFDSSDLSLLDGWSHDDNTVNGSGKTAILNALAFGLYGDMPRSITSSSFLRKGTKHGFAIVEVETPEGLWKVKRERPKKVTYWLNDVQTIIEQEDFEQKIGLNYKQFLLVQYFSQSKKDRFLLLNDSDKKDFLLKIINMDKFAAAKKLVYQDLCEADKKLTSKNSLLSSIESKLEVMEGLISSEEALLDKLESLSTNALDEAISRLSGVPRPDNSKYQEIESKIKSKKQEFNEIRINIATLRKEYALVGRQIKEYQDFDSIPCPHCEEEVTIVSDSLCKASDLKAQNSKVDAHNAIVKERQAELAREINSLESKLLKESDIADLERKLREKQKKDAEQYTQAVSDLADAKSKKAMIEQEKTHIKANLSQISQHKANIDKLTIQKETLLDEINDLSNEIAILTSTEEILSTTGVQAYVTESVVNMINQKATEYLDCIWPNALYKLLSYRENQSGDVKSKFSERIYVSGNEMTIGSLSGGELCCLSLVLDMAIVDVVANFCGINICPIFLDEPFTGMDTANREKAIELLADLAKKRQIWIVDHDAEAKTLFSRCVKIEKRAGISTLVEDV